MRLSVPDEPGGRWTRSSAATAAPRAPAMSRSGTSANVGGPFLLLAQQRVLADRARNQSRKCGAASTTPPPTKYACGSTTFAAIVNSRPIAAACWPNTALASGSSRSP